MRTTAWVEHHLSFTCSEHTWPSARALDGSSDDWYPDTSRPRSGCDSPDWRSDETICQASKPLDLDRDFVAGFQPSRSRLTQQNSLGRPCGDDIARLQRSMSAQKGNYGRHAEYHVGGRRM